MTKRLSSFLSACLLVWVLSEPALADVVAIESHVGARPAGAESLLVPVFSGLSGEVMSPEELASRVDKRLSAPARLLSAEEIAEARRFVDGGYQQFIAGNFGPAVQELDRGLAIIGRGLATLARRPDDRDIYMKGLIGLALAHKRLGNGADATRAMAELVRSFPDKEISNREYGPEPRDLFSQVKKDLDDQGRGALEVRVDDPKTVVFLNERYVGVGHVRIDELVPGRYRVFTQQGERPGRIHEVAVEPGDRATLSLTWGLESALRTEGGRVELVFADERSRAELEGPHAVRVARAVHATGAIAIGVREHRGRRAVVGSSYHMDSSRPERSAAVAVEPVLPTTERLSALGRFLSGDPAAAELVDFTGSDVVAAPGGGDDRGGGGSAPWKWLALGGGVAAAATGVTLLALHEPELVGGQRNPGARDTRTAGIVTLSVGAALTGLGVYLFVTDRGRASRGVAPAAVGDGFGLVVSGRF